MKRVLILGGGFGGVQAANTLRKNLASDDEIILVDRRTHFMVGFRQTWALVKKSPMEAGQRALADLTRKGIKVVRGTISAIDPKARAAEVDGTRIQADALVVALGADLAPEKIPGFQDRAFNVYDRQDIPRAAEALQRFSGGRIVVGIFGAPYKCPAAPYEMALLVDEFMKARGVKAAIEVFSPQPMSLPTLGPAGCNIIESRLAKQGITFLPNHKATAVEDREIIFTNDRRQFDLLLGIAPHQCPQVVNTSGLIDAGDWVRVNPRTCETEFENVYAIGDTVEIPMADKKPLPKAGVFAEAMGQIVAERIAASFVGKQSSAVFSGEGGCYLEVGNGQAMMVQGNFLAEPAPEVILTEPSAALLDEKRSYEADRLKTWFS